MTRVTTQTNGVEKNFGLASSKDKGGVVTQDGNIFTVVYKFDVLDLPGVDLDTTGDGAADSYSKTNVKVPAGARILDAKLRVTTAFAGGTNVTIGLQEQDATEIDNDGIDAAVATSALNAAGKIVDCDGALVGAAAVLANTGYIVGSVSGTYTAGEADLVIRYELQNTRGA